MLKNHILLFKLINSLNDFFELSLKKIINNNKKTNKNVLLFFEINFQMIFLSTLL